MRNIENKSISALGGWKWNGEIPKRETHGGIETRFYELHNKPISELEFDDIRFLIGQNEGLEYLVPIALEKLREDLFFEAEYYEGDLFQALLQINDAKHYWNKHSDEKKLLIELYQSQKNQIESLGIPKDVLKKIKEDYMLFTEK